MPRSRGGPGAAAPEYSWLPSRHALHRHADLRPATAHTGVEHLVGIDRIRDRLTLLTRAVREEVMSFSPDGAQSTANTEASRPLDLRLLERGIRTRTLYLDSVRHYVPTVAYADWP
ncbi:hypothetical protein ACFVXQ_33645, partial [Kitasatospora sp. NPDC058263]